MSTTEKTRDWFGTRSKPFFRTSGQPPKLVAKHLQTDRTAMKRPGETGPQFLDRLARTFTPQAQKAETGKAEQDTDASESGRAPRFRAIDQPVGVLTELIPTSADMRDQLGDAAPAFEYACRFFTCVAGAAMLDRDEREMSKAATQIEADPAAIAALDPDRRVAYFRAALLATAYGLTRSWGLSPREATFGVAQVAAALCGLFDIPVEPATVVMLEADGVGRGDGESLREVTYSEATAAMALASLTATSIANAVTVADPVTAFTRDLRDMLERVSKLVAGDSGNDLSELVNERGRRLRVLKDVLSRHAEKLPRSFYDDLSVRVLESTVRMKDRVRAMMSGEIGVDDPGAAEAEALRLDDFLDTMVECGVPADEVEPLRDEVAERRATELERELKGSLGTRD